jgi:transcriptional regulator with XRE-family HTH domain
MSSEKRSGKTETQLAVVELRKHAGMTQQQLAVEMGLSIVTVTRWETSRPPQGIYLLHLASIAKKLKRPDLQRIFMAGIVSGGIFLQSGHHPQTVEATKAALFWLNMCAGHLDYMCTSQRFVNAYRAAIGAIKVANFELLREVREGGMVARFIPRDQLEATQLLLEEIEENESLRSLRSNIKGGSDESK